ncbi:MAG TPA: hypothetical protein VK915_14250 [Gaiellaceae bacterium]|nr:hypothetical protein [Gaiellaceae bacterium]
MRALEPAGREHENGVLHLLSSLDGEAALEEEAAAQARRRGERELYPLGRDRGGGRALPEEPEERRDGGRG